MPQVVFRPAAQVPETGIYKGRHFRKHRQATDVVLIRNDNFPKCEICGARVTFRLVRAAPYILEDADFSESAKEKAA